MDTMMDCSNYNHYPATLQELIESLHVVFATDTVNVEEVQTLMKNYKSNEDDWEKFAKYDRHRYTRNLVDVGNGRFNLMVLAWGEGQGSSIHSHSDAHCFMKILDGSLRETLFHWPSESEKRTEMKQLAANDYYKDEVAYINDSKGLHRVENLSHSDYACSLHLYSPPFESCMCFDQRTGRCATSKVTFWSKFGERTPFPLDKLFIGEPAGLKNNFKYTLPTKLPAILTRKYDFEPYPYIFYDEGYCPNAVKLNILRAVILLSIMLGIVFH